MEKLQDPPPPAVGVPERRRGARAAEEAEAEVHPTAPTRHPA